MPTAFHRYAIAAFAVCATMSLAACRQDQILTEAAKFEDIQKNLHSTTAAVVAAPLQGCIRDHALNGLIQPFNPATVNARLAKPPATECQGVQAQTKVLNTSLSILDDYAIALVRAAKGQALPDPKIGDLAKTLNGAGVEVVPNVKTDDINKVFNGLEALLDRNLRANQLRHIVREVEPSLMRVTTGLSKVFSDPCPAGLWCSFFADEANDLKTNWGRIAHSTQEGANGGVLQPHTPEYFVAQWELRRRFEEGVKAHDDAVALGPAYADALLAFQREHTALLGVIDAPIPDNTAIFNR